MQMARVITAIATMTRKQALSQVEQPIGVESCGSLVAALKIATAVVASTVSLVLLAIPVAYQDNHGVRSHLFSHFCQDLEVPHESR